MKGTIAIIGMGWLGSALAEIKANEGHRVIGTIRNAMRCRGELPKGVSALHFSLGRPLPEALSTAPAPMSAIISISPSTTAMSPLMQENHLHKLARDLFAMGAKRIIYTSATSVYPTGIADAKETDAADISSPRSGVSLFRLEQAVISGAKETPVIIIRFGGLFGPGREPGRFFTRRPLTYPDDPVNLIHLDDCIGVLSLALTLDKSEVINAVAPHHPERGLFYTAAALAVGEQPPMSYGAAGSAVPKIVNVEKLTNTLGYRFQHPNPLSLYF